MPNAKCQMPNAKCQMAKMPNVKCQNAKLDYKIISKIMTTVGGNLDILGPVQ
jgi:hypothetical protein